MGYLEDVTKIYDRAIRMYWERVAMCRGNDFFISIAELKLLEPLSTYLFEFLKPFGYNSKIVADIVSSLDGLSGKQFVSATHRLVRDRESLILTPIHVQNFKQFYLEEGIRELIFPVHLKISVLERKDQFKIPDARDMACIDQEKIQFPMLIRRWKQGDYFKPLGMKGFKKVSDFFIDLKLSIPEKEKVWILANGEYVVWIIGHRLDDRYKITPLTQHILKLEMVL